MANSQELRKQYNEVEQNIIAEIALECFRLGKNVIPISRTIRGERLEKIRYLNGGMVQGHYDSDSEWWNITEYPTLIMVLEELEKMKPTD